MSESEMIKIGSFNESIGVYQPIVSKKDSFNSVGFEKNSYNLLIVDAENKPFPISICNDMAILYLINLGFVFKEEYYRLKMDRQTGIIVKTRVWEEASEFEKVFAKKLDVVDNRYYNDLMAVNRYEWPENTNSSIKQCLNKLDSNNFLSIGQPGAIFEQTLHAIIGSLFIEILPIECIKDEGLREVISILRNNREEFKERIDYNSLNKLLSFINLSLLKEF